MILGRITQLVSIVNRPEPVYECRRCGTNVDEELTLVLNADQKRSLSTKSSDPGMSDDYDLVVEIIAENPGAAVEELSEFAADHGIDRGRVQDLLAEAANQGDLLEFDERYWVMRKGEYAFNRFDHPETDLESSTD